MPGAIFLEGDHVTLRPVEADDAAFLRDHSNHPAIRRPMTINHPSNLDRKREHIEEMYDDESGGFGLLACADGERVGYVMLFRLDDAAGHAEVAYWIAPDAQGEGYGTEAAALVLDYAFGTRRLHRVRARVLAHNTVSREVLEKLGFTEEGVQRDEKYVDGEYVDTHFFGMLEDEWEGSEAF